MNLTNFYLQNTTRQTNGFDPSLFSTSPTAVKEGYFNGRIKGWDLYQPEVQQGANIEQYIVVNDLHVLNDLP